MNKELIHFILSTAAGTALPPGLSNLVGTGIEIAFKLMANHAKKAVVEMTPAELLAALEAIKIRSVEELLAEGGRT